MDSFFIGLQFLTRLHVVKQTVWTEEAFGRSVRYFPLVGLVLGAVYGAVALALSWLPVYAGCDFPVHVRAAALAVLPVKNTSSTKITSFALISKSIWLVLITGSG